jgi:poly(A) polymerase
MAATAGPGEEGPLALAYRVGVAGAVDRLLIAGEDVSAITDWTPPAFPFSGGALVERGLRKGPDVAAMLRRVETQWISEGFPGAERVAVIADGLVAEVSA